MANFKINAEGESMVNEEQLSREKLVYSARHNSRSDLFTGMGLRVMDFMEVAHWASNRQIQIGMRGYATKRYTTLERILKRKSKNGELRSAIYDQIKVYAKPMKSKTFDGAKIYHGLGCTECAVSYKAAAAALGMEYDMLPERLFRSYGRVPEFGMRYEYGTILLCEFSTKHDVNHTGKIRGKLNGYDDCLPDIERDFNAKPFVVFVLDVPRDRVRRLVSDYDPSRSHFFTDYETFKSVPMGQALIAPIYIWKDGKEYPLTK
jgi:hypothetical protein